MKAESASRFLVTNLNNHSKIRIKKNINLKTNACVFFPWDFHPNIWKKNGSLESSDLFSLNTFLNETQGAGSPTSQSFFFAKRRPPWEEQKSTFATISKGLKTQLNPISGWLVVEPIHLKNMFVKLEHETPRIGVKIPKIFELPPPSWPNTIIFYQPRFQQKIE